MQNECACGCGEFLPDGSVRQYKRGHKTKPVAQPVTQPDIYADDDDDSPLSLEDASASTPDDPEPPDDSVKPVAPPVRITKAVRRDVEAKIAFMLTLGSNAWELTDPLCGNVMLNQTPDIAARLTPIICQSPEVVKWFRRGGNFMLYVDLFIAFMPVFQVVFAHHVAKNTESEMPDASQYPVAA